jgi:hypothetical protein
MIDTGKVVIGKFYEPRKLHTITPEEELIKFILTAKTKPLSEVVLPYIYAIALFVLALDLFFWR